MGRKILCLLTGVFMLAATTVTAQENRLYEKLIGKGYDTINVENEGARRFLDDRAYSDSGTVSNYSYSIVKKYSKGMPSKPAGITLRWNSSTPTKDISSVVVSLVESEKELSESALDKQFRKETVRRYYPSISSKEYLLCNMCPQRYCYYRIEEVLKNGRKTLLKEGKFYTLGRVRMLRVDGMVNVRDFGGWPTSFGRTTVYGRLFRGNRPDNITDTGRNDFVKNEHVTADLDLRGVYRSKSAFGSLEDVEYYYTNNARYKLALTSRTKVLAQDLNIIASVLRRGGGVFLHCYHGVNRAGTLAFVVDGLLGLSEEDLSREYEMSSFAYGTTRNRTFGEMLPEIRSYGKSDDELAQCFYNFARSIGVSEENLDTIRCVMLGLSPDDKRILEAHK